MIALSVGALSSSHLEAALWSSLSLPPFLHFFVERKSFEEKVSSVSRRK